MSKEFQIGKTTITLEDTIDDGQFSSKVGDFFMAISVDFKTDNQSFNDDLDTAYWDNEYSGYNEEKRADNIMAVKAFNSLLSSLRKLDAHFIFTDIALDANNDTKFQALNDLIKWFGENPNHLITLGEIKLYDGDNKHEFQIALEAEIKKGETTFDQISTLFNGYKFSGLWARSILQTFVKHNTINFEQFEELLALVDKNKYGDNPERRTMAGLYKADSILNGRLDLTVLNYEQIQKLIQYVDKLNFDQFKKLADLVPDTNQKSNVILAGLEKLQGNLSVEQALYLARLTTKPIFKATIVWLCFKNQKENMDELISMVSDKDIDIRYNNNAMKLVCEMVGYSAEQICIFADKLYPNNELLKVELVIDCLYLPAFRDESSKKEAIAALKDFIEKITPTVDAHNDPAFNLISEVRRRAQFSEKDILDLCSGRTKTQYQAIDGLLKEKSLAESLMPETLSELKTLMGVDAEDKEWEKNTKLDALFSYYELKEDGLGLFVSSLRPEVLTDLQTNFKIPEEQLYFTSKEHGNLQALLGDQMPEIPSMQVLCDYLKAKVSDVKQYSQEDFDSYKITFPSDSIFTEEQKISLNSKLASLFQSKNPSADEVSDFMIEVAGQSENPINYENRNKIRDIFVKQKNNFAALLHHPEGAYRIAALFTTNEGIKEGCSASSGTKLQSVIDAMQIEDPVDRVLYSLFANRIKDSVFGQTGTDHLGGSPEGTNAFENTAITETFLSATSLVNAITKELEDNGPDHKLIWQIIDTEIKTICQADEKMTAGIKSTLVDDEFEPEAIKQKEKELIPLAVYLAVNRVLGEQIPKDLFKDKELLGKRIPNVHTQLLSTQALSGQQSLNGGKV
ncbi:MAG: hypothetical protein ACJAZX_000914 [Rickettsiales bacterium]|jgi:hypothetical protein